MQGRQEFNYQNSKHLEKLELLKYTGSALNKLLKNRNYGRFSMNFQLIKKWKYIDAF